MRRLALNGHHKGACQCGGRCGGGRRGGADLILDRTWPGRLAEARGTPSCGCSHRVCPRRDHAAAGLVLVWSRQGAGSPADALVALFYLLGIGTAVYHFVNGVSTSAEVWDFTPTPSSKHALWKLRILGGIGLGLVGFVSWYAFAVQRELF